MKASSNGMTLVELLMVLAIISLLVAGSGWVFRPHPTMGQTGTSLAAIVEVARNTALAHNTYVWLGFESKTDSAGNPLGVEVAVIESLTGQSADLTVPGNVQQVMRPQLLNGASLASSSGMNFSGMDAATGDAVDLVNGSSSTTTFSLVSGGGTQTFSDIIQFSSQGETMLPQANLYPWVDVGLKPSRGTPNDKAALQISGVTGEVQMFQP